MTMKASEIFTAVGSSLKSLAKVALLSRPVSRPPRASKAGDKIIILGNGPSLRQTVGENIDTLRAMPSVAVNFMANTPEFEQIKPDYYVLADPLFFSGTEHENVASLWRNLARVRWPMCLCVPRKMLAKTKKLLSEAPSVKIVPFNFVGAEGFGRLENVLYSSRLAMPRPRNVLIPAIMIAISAGYSEIWLCGADHSWLETVRVTDANHVVSVQPHFYADSSKELKRSEEEYRGLHLHDILMSFYIAFSAYHRIKRYAESRGIRIYNATPGSYIDAFPRKMI